MNLMVLTTLCSLHKKSVDVKRTLAKQLRGGDALSNNMCHLISKFLSWYQVGPTTRYSSVGPTRYLVHSRL